MKRPRTLVELVARNVPEGLSGDLVAAVAVDCRVADFVAEIDEGVRRWDAMQLVEAGRGEGDAERV